MQRWVVWLVVGALPWMCGCQRTSARVTPAPAGSGAAIPGTPGVGSTTAPAGAPLPGTPGATTASPQASDKPAPKPRPRRTKEIVIAWEASLMYLLKDGKLAGKPLILNGAKHRYLRDEHLGSFTISEKMRLKRSNLYDVNGDPLPDRKLSKSSGAVMRNWMRLGGLPVGLHYSPAFRFIRSPRARHRSHGCYRMSRRDSNAVFKWTPAGTPIHVVRSLGGTEWASLLAQTPPELLPRGASTVAETGDERPSRRRRRARPTARPAVAVAPRPTVSAAPKKAAPKQPAEPPPAAEPEPPQAAEPEPPAPPALESDGGDAPSPAPDTQGGEPPASPPSPDEGATEL